MRHYLTHFGMSTIKKTTISNACKDVEKKEAFIHCCWEYNWFRYYRKWCGNFKEYFGHLLQRTDTLEKTMMLGKTEGRRR